MNKKYIFPLLALALASCTNFFDEKQLGNTGYEPTHIPKEPVVYIVTSDDVAQITKAGSVYEQKALSLCSPEDSSAYAAWKDIASLKAFNEAADADIYLPAFMAEKFPYYSKGSIVKAQYPYYKGKTTRVAPFNSATGYVMTKDDYEAVWNGHGALFLNSDTEPVLAEWLSKKFATATDGKVVVLTYSYLHADPEAITPFLPYECSIGELLETEENVEHQLTGIIGSAKFSTAQSKFWLVDGTDSIYVYGLMDEDGEKAVKTKNLQKGDKVTVRGKYHNENGEPQLHSAVYVSHVSGPMPVRAYAPKAAADTLTKTVIYQLNDGEWSIYSHDQLNAAFALPQSVYTAANQASITNPEATIITYLRANYPYAAAKDVYLVAYRGASGMTADEFTYDGTDWTMNTGFTTEEMNFVRGDNWIADISTYYTTPFVNNGLADFTIQHVNLDGLSYVWRYQASYGATASAYVSGTNHVVEDWLISPSIRLKKSVQPKMHFDHAVRYGLPEYNKEVLKVMVTNNFTGDVTTTEWEHLTFPDSIPNGSNWQFLSTGEFDLSAYNNQSIVVAFQYNTAASGENSAPTWEIQNLLIYEPQE